VCQLELLSGVLLHPCGGERILELLGGSRLYIFGAHTA
jgi:hypothetical protein